MKHMSEIIPEVMKAPSLKAAWDKGYAEGFRNASLMAEERRAEFPAAEWNEEQAKYGKASIISTITMMNKDLKFEDLNALPYVELEELRDRLVRMRRQRN